MCDTDIFLEFIKVNNLLMHGQAHQLLWRFLYWISQQ